MERDKSLPLHLKYRPQTFDELIGNDSVKQSLKTIFMRKEAIPHVFLLQGPSGCGKTTTGRIIAKMLECPDSGITEINVASARGIDTIRDIIETSQYAPLIGKTKVYILDEVARGTLDFQSSALKLLEDCPSYCYLILCTTDPEKLLKTIKTRCSTFNFSSLTRGEVLKLLNWVCKEEKVELSKEVLNKIAECCDGSPRQALVLLDQVIDIIDDEVSLQTIIDNTIDEKNIVDLCKAILNSKSWSEMATIIRGIKEEPEKVRHSVGGYMAAVLLNGENINAIIALDILESTNFMYSGKWGLTSTFYKIYHSIKK